MPTLNRILQVSKEVTEFLDKDKENVVVIHCRGGKGRTGTIVCSVLLDRYRLSSPEEVLEHFEEMRTNYFGEKKQGLSTPSQERYVRYFYDLVRKDHPEVKRCDLSVGIEKVVLREHSTNLEFIKLIALR